MKTNPWRVSLVVTVFIMVTTLVGAGEPVTASRRVVPLTPGEAEAIVETLTKAYGSPLEIGAAAFRSDGNNPEQLHFAGNLGILQGQDAENAYAVAPLYLPEGATISSAMASVFDGLGSAVGGCDEASELDVGVWMFRVVNSTGEAQQMAFFGTSGQSGSVQHLLESSVDYPTIEYPQYAYYAVTRLCHSAQNYHNLQIWYSMP